MPYLSPQLEAEQAYLRCARCRTLGEEVTRSEFAGVVADLCGECRRGASWGNPEQK